jgi:hypothetical protein
MSKRRTNVSPAVADAFREMRTDLQVRVSEGIPKGAIVVLAPGEATFTLKVNVDPAQIAPFSPEDVRVYLGQLGITPEAIHGLPAPEAEA